MKVNFFVGPAIELTALEDYKKLLNRAYEKGLASGGTMDWSDVKAALAKAIEALGGDAEQFYDAAENGDIEEGHTAIFFTPGTHVTPTVKSAGKLLFAFRYPDDVKRKDVDEAWRMVATESVAA